MSSAAQPLLTTHQQQSTLTPPPQQTNTKKVTTSNLYLLCFFSLTFHAGWSIWERNLFPVWVVLEIEKSNSTSYLTPTQAVGMIQSFQGLTALLVGPIFGTIIDSITTISSFQILTRVL